MRNKKKAIVVFDLIRRSRRRNRVITKLYTIALTWSDLKRYRFNILRGKKKETNVETSILNQVHIYRMYQSKPSTRRQN